MCSQSPHCPDSLGTPSPTPSLTPRLPTFLSPTLPWTLLLLPSPRVTYRFESLLEFWRRFTPWRSSLAATMVHSSSSSICRILLLVFLGLLVAFVHTGKTPVESVIIFTFQFCGFRVTSIQFHLFVLPVIFKKMKRHTRVQSRLSSVADLNWNVCMMLYIKIRVRSWVTKISGNWLDKKKLTTFYFFFSELSSKLQLFNIQMVSLRYYIQKYL